MTYPDGEVVTNTYLPQMLLNTMTGTDNYITGSQYDSAGRLVKQNFGNEIEQTRAYNPWNSNGGRMQNLTAGTLQNLTYTYNAVGDILTIFDANAGPQTQTFTYDALDRLTSASSTGGQDGLYNEAYTYDLASGNLASKGGNTYTYADPAHAHAVTNLSNGNSYTYDANGNMVARVVGTDTYNQSYNAENKLTQVAKNGTTIAAFVYDGDGNRVASTINGTTTKFVGEYYEVTGADITKYYGKTALRKNGVLTYLLADHLGSNSYIVNTSGTKLSETRYTAWGEIRYATGTTSTPYTYTGQYSNTSDFGWMYYKARWYDPSLGRFNQPDSIVPGAGDPRAWDRFAYVKNNPVVYIDPSGHYACDEIKDGKCINNGGSTSATTYETPSSTKTPNNQPKNNNTNHTYNGINAGIWADENWNNFREQCHGYSCTEFVSTALNVGGLTMTDEWNSGQSCTVPNQPWNNASALFDYLTNIMGFPIIEINLSDPQSTLVTYDIPAGMPVFYSNGSVPVNSIYQNNFIHAAITTGDMVATTTARYPYVITGPQVSNHNGAVMEPHLLVDIGNFVIRVVVVIIQ